MPPLMRSNHSVLRRPPCNLVTRVTVDCQPPDYPCPIPSASGKTSDTDLLRIAFKHREVTMRTHLIILTSLTCTASATLDAQAADTVPARLILARGDTAALIIPDTVRRGHAFTVTVTAFAGGCIREAGGSRVSIDRLVADVTPLHVRRVVGNFCH